MRYTSNGSSGTYMMLMVALTMRRSHITLFPLVNFSISFMGRSTNIASSLEHVLAHTARTFSLSETMMMVVALRTLRFCYGSSLLGRESLLYKNQ